MHPEEIDAPKETLPNRDHAVDSGAIAFALDGRHGEGGAESSSREASPDGRSVPNVSLAPGKEPIDPPEHHPQVLDEPEHPPQVLDAPEHHPQVLGAFQPVAGDFVTAERFAARIVVSVLLVGGFIAFLGWAVGLLAARAALWHWGLWTLSLVGFIAFLAFLGWFLHAWPAIEHKHLSWRLNAIGLEIQKGVWWRHRISVPRDRVQHVDVEQGPLMRRYGIAKLIVHTAGTHAPTIELPGLSMAIAQDLKNQLTRPTRGSHD